jgi:hypothetical protein
MVILASCDKSMSKLRQIEQCADYDIRFLDLRGLLRSLNPQPEKVKCNSLLNIMSYLYVVYLTSQQQFILNRICGSDLLGHLINVLFLNFSLLGNLK